MNLVYFPCDQYNLLKNFKVGYGMKLEHRYYD